MPFPGNLRIVETPLSYTQSTFSPHSVHFQPHVDPHSVHVGVHVRGSPCPGTPGNLWRSTPDGGNHVELCDRHVETRGPKGIRINWGVPTFHGAASFVGVKGEDIRTLRARRPEASAVCRKAAGSRPHPVPGSHTQLHAIPMESTCNPRMWPRAVHVRGSTWTPWRSTSKGVAKGMVEGAGGPYASGAGRPDGLGE
jgi:hypothetical protein